MYDYVLLYLRTYKYTLDSMFSGLMLSATCCEPTSVHDIPTSRARVTVRSLLCTLGVICRQCSQRVLVQETFRLDV